MHVAGLLLSVLYIAPLAAITWHTLTERLSSYRRIYFPEDAPFQAKKPHLQKRVEFPRTVFLNLCDSVGYTTSNVFAKMFTMSTRYWDEIDWCIQEGALKYCEMLKSENEDASSAQWSTGEEEDYFAQQDEGSSQDAEDTTEENIKDADAENISKKLEDISIKDTVSDVDSVKDEEDYVERSTSVDDEKPEVIEKQTKVDDLMSMCAQCKMMPPIYTYFTTGNEQVVSTVQLWNGVRFSSRPQTTRDEAMEAAAGHALDYLKSELRENRTVRTSPPVSVPPYYVPIQSLLHHQQCYTPPHTAFAPVAYAAAPTHPYFLPSVQFAVLPQASAVTVPSEYPQAAIVHPRYGISPHHYNPYLQHYPFVRLHASPTHQSKGATAYHRITPGPKPAIWIGYPNDLYLIEDKANSARAEYRLLDQQPASESLTTNGSWQRRASEASGGEQSYGWKGTTQKTDEKTASKQAHNDGKPTMSKWAIDLSQ